MHLFISDSVVKGYGPPLAAQTMILKLIFFIQMRCIYEKKKKKKSDCSKSFLWHFKLPKSYRLQA